MTRSIPAKPTTYKGINMRSRLEARWAAMFDMLGWSWEYEPEIGQAYIPDFLLHGKDGVRVYVEIKPEGIWNAERGDIIKKASWCIENYEFIVLTDEFRPCGLNCEPLAAFGYSPFPDETGLCIEYIRLFRLDECGWDIAHSWGSWQGRLTGFYDGDYMERGLTSLDDVRDLWQKAGNAIQWQPRK